MNIVVELVGLCVKDDIDYVNESIHDHTHMCLLRST